MLKLIFRDLFIYQGKNLYVLPLFSVVIIIMMQMFGATTGFPLAVMAMALFALLMTTQLTFNSDETSKFNRFLRATPTSAKAIVFSRYASCVLSVVMGVLVTFIVGALMNVASALYPMLWRDITVDIGTLIACTISVFLICALLFPILFKFGYGKAKYPLMLLLIGIGSSTPMLITDKASQGLDGLLSAISIGGLLMLLVISLIFFYCSIIISTMIFKRKEV